MPAKKFENYINDDQLSRLVAKDTGITIKAITEMREAQNEVLKALIRRGKVITLYDIGTFKLKDHQRKKAREFKKPYNGEVVWLEEKPAYQSPLLKFTKSFRDDIKSSVKVEEDG